MEKDQGNPDGDTPDLPRQVDASDGMPNDLAPLGGTGGTSPSARCDDLDVGLVGHWRFEEGKGTRVIDSSGHGNDGTIVQGGTARAPAHAKPPWSEGHEGGGLHLNGIDEWVRVSGSKSINALGSAVSVTAWIRPDRFSSLKDGVAFVVSRHELGTRLERFGLGLYGGLPMGAIHFSRTAGSDDVPLKTWAHMAMTYDGATLRVYFAGKEVSSLDIGWPLTVDETPVAIGAGINEDDAIEQFAGVIDDVRLYARVLQPCEIRRTIGLK